MKATPRSTANAVASRRSLRAASSLMVSLEHDGQPPRVRMRSRTESAVGSSRSSTIRPSARNTARSAYDGGDGVMGDHDDRLAELAHRGAHERQDLGAGAGVEVAGRLVGEDDLGTAGEGAGDGDALLLPARELRRSVLQAVLQPDGLDDLVEPRRVGLAAGEAAGSAMFSAAVSVGTRLKDWKMNPMRSRRSWVSWRSSSSVRCRCHR